MNISLLKAKLHGATVTEAELDYDGSLTIDKDLMDLVKLVPFEEILVANLTNGERFVTYVIEGPPGSGVFCLNGATAHKGQVGDEIIVMNFCSVPASEAHAHRPLIVRLTPDNKPDGPLKAV